MNTVRERKCPHDVGFRMGGAFLFVAGILGLFFLLGGYPAAAACTTDISNIPLDTMQTSAPGIIMFGIDDSGSMDWDTICPEYDGTFDAGTNYDGYGYVFDIDGNFPQSEKLKWKSQWSGYNSLYYNPDIYYAPWPQWSTIASSAPASAPNMDLNNPRLDPMKSSTYNLSDTYMTLYNTDVTTAMEQQGIIVDDSNSGNGDIIVDNSDTGFSVSSNSARDWTAFSCSHCINGSSVVYRERSGDGTVTATWTITVPSAGSYNVGVSWSPVRYQKNNEAVYTVYYDDGSGSNTQTSSVPETQTYGGAPWVSLGTFNFAAGTAKVTLTFAGFKGHCGYKWSCPNRVSADAVRLHPTFSSTTAGSTQFTTLSGNWHKGTSTAAYNGEYLYTGSSGEAVWKATNLDPGQTYDVYVRYYGDWYYSTSVPYTVTSSSGTQTTDVDQTSDVGNWIRIAKGVQFTNGIGTVTLDYPGSRWGAYACADAVGFIPSNTIQKINISAAHYFVQNNNGTFLVNVNGGSLSYYQVHATNGVINYVTPISAATAQADDLVTGTYADGNYAEERQNFANWFSFYRKRILTAKAAVASVIASESNVEIGILTLWHRIVQYPLLVNATINGTHYDNTTELLTELYGDSAGGGTPLRTMTIDIGEFFEGKNVEGGPQLVPSKLPAPYDTLCTLSDDSSKNTYPFFKAEYGGTCQQAFTIITTDGYYNGNLSTLYAQNYDGTAANPSKITIGNVDGPDQDNPPDPGACGKFNCGKYGDSVYNTLADISMKYYMTDLSPALANNVPVNEYDTNPAQHLVTYTFSFGLNGTINQTDYSTCPVGTCPTWPTFNPNDGLSDPEKIDDLWHAAVNGRGEYLSASSPQDIIAALQAFKQNIQNRIGSAASLAANSVSLQKNTVIYQGIYNSNNWYGDLLAKSVNVGNGLIGNTNWSAAKQLSSISWDNRIIFTDDGTTGIPFEYGSLSTTQQSELSSNTTTARNMVDYLRGDTANNEAHGGPFRTRSGPLGDIVHSAPAYYDNVVYVGANDGMLHAFNAATGDELFAYIPDLVFPNLNLLASPAYTHSYYVDNTAYIKDIGTPGSPDVLLVGGLGKGGMGYYCLNVTKVSTTSNSVYPANESDAADMFMWEYPKPGATDPDMGYSFSQAYIIKTNSTTYPYLVMFGNGYGSPNGDAVLYFLDPKSGDVVREIKTDVFNCNGLSTPTAIDGDNSGTVDYVYAGDLQGDLWKFDLTSNDPGQWHVAYANGSTPEPLFTARNASGEVQPITDAPDVMYQCNSSLDGYLVLFGTGKYLGDSDSSDKTVQSVYGIWDWADAWTANGVDPTGLYLGAFNGASPRTLSNIAGNTTLSANAQHVTLLQQTVSAVSGTPYFVVTDNPIDYYNPKTDTGKNVGWYFDLPEAGERVVHDPLIRNGTGVFVSSIPAGSPCAPGGTSVIYMVDACSGGPTVKPQFDINGDHVFNEKDTITVGGNKVAPQGQAVNSMLYNPMELEGSAADFLYFSSANGAAEVSQVQRIPTGAFYWMQY